MKFKIILTFVIVISILIGIYATFFSSKEKNASFNGKIKIGFFDGIRNYTFFRAYLNNDFDEILQLYTGINNSNPVIEIEKNHDWFVKQKKENEFFGLVTGDKIISFIEQGDLDGGLIGSGSFLTAVERGAPIVAVASIGVCESGNPCRALVLNRSKGVKIDNVDDWKKKKVCVFRDNSVDYLAIKKYFKKIGLEKDVEFLIANSWDEWTSFYNNEADACVYHYNKAKNFEESAIYDVIDSIDSSLFQTLLVFHEDFLLNNKADVEKILSVYKQRIEYERDLTPEEFEKLESKSETKKIMTDSENDRLSPPATHEKMIVDYSSLESLKKLMLEEKILHNDFDVRRYIDDRFNEIDEVGFENVILIGWDGVQREHLLQLLRQDKLPNLKKIISKGKYLDIGITTGATETKPGWAQILTGYNPEITGVYSNREYGPIPGGYTILERLENHFGDENIETIFLAGKDHNLGTRGPHKICLNCTRGTWFDGENSEPLNQHDKELKNMDGEPYFFSQDNIDFFENGLLKADVVGKTTLEFIERFKNKKFFIFIQFREPDQPGGHTHGENSDEYSEGIILDDKWLGLIIEKLNDINIYDRTLIYITSDHGFDEDAKEHFNAPYVFLVTNDKMIKKQSGDRKDIAPTILDRFGVSIDSISPTLNGTSLIR